MVGIIEVRRRSTPIGTIIRPPLRTQPPYADAPVLGGTTAVSIAERVLCLPCAAHLTTEQQDEVIDRVLAVLRSG